MAPQAAREAGNYSMGRLSERKRSLFEEKPASEPFYDLTGVRFVRVRDTGEINLTRLAESDRKRWAALWKKIKRNNPKLAALLKEPELHALREKFNGHIILSKRVSSLPDDTGR
jgi:hypothetical protein